MIPEGVNVLPQSLLPRLADTEYLLDWRPNCSDHVVTTFASILRVTAPLLIERLVAEQTPASVSSRLAVWSRLNSGTLRVNFDSRLERPFWRSCGRVNELIISRESEIGLVFTGPKFPPPQIRVPQIFAP